MPAALVARRGAPLYGYYYCERMSHCLVGVIPLVGCRILTYRVSRRAPDHRAVTHYDVVVLGAGPGGQCGDSRRTARPEHDRRTQVLGRKYSMSAVFPSARCCATPNWSIYQGRQKHGISGETFDYGIAYDRSRKVCREVAGKSP